MSDVKKEQVFTLATLFCIAKKINLKVNKDVNIDQEKEDKIIFNSIIDCLEKGV